MPVNPVAMTWKYPFHRGNQIPVTARPHLDQRKAASGMRGEHRYQTISPRPAEVQHMRSHVGHRRPPAGVDFYQPSVHNRIQAFSPKNILLTESSVKMACTDLATMEAIESTLRFPIR